MNKEVRVRFAPSPTGYLHIGGARTAVFNWIFAKSSKGKFLLRIEDTDRARSTREYLELIINSLTWLGLKWDEDIYIQSDNIDKHRLAVKTLLEKGAAYKCFCTPENLDQKRKAAQEQKRPMHYDGACRKLSGGEASEKENSGEPFTVRCKIPEGETVFNDLIHGKTVVKNSEIDDFIIQRQDLTPTYMLAVVIDDHLMNISHVIRGDDHLSNTPKQVILYRALGWDEPDFAHMPMIIGPDMARFSKRHGAVSVEACRERGYLPEAVCNYLTLLGWSPGGDREKIEMDEAVRLFRIEDSHKKSAVFDEKKLLWMNGLYISATANIELAERLKPVIAKDEKLAALVGEKGSDYLQSVLELNKQRIKLLPDFISYCGYFYRDPVTYDPDAVKKHWKETGTIERLARVRLCVLGNDDPTIEGIESAMRILADEMDIKAAKLIHPVRLALTGYGVSPGLFDVMHLLGKETVVRRIEKAITFLEGAS